jgi:hypothetical protein
VICTCQRSGLIDRVSVGTILSSYGNVIGTDYVPTVTDNLYAQGTIHTAIMGVSFQPYNSSSQTTGELTFGDVDPSKSTGSIRYAPITITWPSVAYFGINASWGVSIQPLGLYSNPGIVDTACLFTCWSIASTAQSAVQGTTLIYLAADVYDHYVNMTRAVLDPDTGFLKIAAADYPQVVNLLFRPGVHSGSSFTITRNAQTWPRALNTWIGGSASVIYLAIADVRLTVFITFNEPANAIPAWHETRDRLGSGPWLQCAGVFLHGIRYRELSCGIHDYRELDGSHQLRRLYQ